MNSIAATQIHFFLAQGVLMQGKVTVPGLAIIEGHFKGELSADTVIVKAGGVIEGTVQADSLLVQGRIIAAATSGPRPVISIHAPAVAAAMPAPAPALPLQRVPVAPVLPVLQVVPAGWPARVLRQPLTRTAVSGWPAQIRVDRAQVRRVHKPSGASPGRRSAPEAATAQGLLH